MYYHVLSWSGLDKFSGELPKSYKKRFDKFSGELPIRANCYKKWWSILCAIEPTIALSRLGCSDAKQLEQCQTSSKLCQ